MTSGIYCITNDAPGHEATFFIGYSRDIERIATSVRNRSRGSMTVNLLHETDDIPSLPRLRTQYVETWRANGFQVTNKPHTAWHTGKNLSDEHRQRLSASVSAGKKGKPLSEPQKLAIKAAVKANWAKKKAQATATER